jgi:lipopolysaccharide cholinephosphotransferase
MRLATQFELREIQLSILDAVHEFCRKNGIQYYLMYGTLLGAVRHAGYIPWDDDIDIAMFREDYEKFIEEFNNNNSDFEVLTIHNSEGYNYFFAKVSYKKSIQIDTNVAFLDTNIGINIDLFPIDKLPGNEDRARILKKLHFLDKLFYSKAFKLKRKTSFRKILAILVGKCITLFTSKKAIGLKQEKIAKQFNNTDSNTYSFISCSIKKELPLFTKDLFEPVKITFEDRRYIAPKGYDIILKSIYGDYMTPPLMENRISGHNFTAYFKEV